ncbi:hypothetical protein D770_13380 [Flammeovirgaceae bacterium 311]|nr:hypothetical protein D770_13380 [Flammeovirgaceae bacterium 311]
MTGLGAEGWVSKKSFFVNNLRCSTNFECATQKIFFQHNFLNFTNYSYKVVAKKRLLGGSLMIFFI